MIRAAIACAGVLSSAALAAPSSGHEHNSFANSPAYEIDSLAENVDNMIKACSAMAVRGGSEDKSVRRPEKAALDAGLLKFYDTPPPDIAAAANPKHGPARFGEWFDPHATILIVSYDNTPMCRAFILRSAWTKSIRPKLYELVQVGDFWRSSQAEQTIDGDLKRAVFQHERPGAKILPMLTITANDNANMTTDVQLTVAVSLVSKGED